MFKNKQAWLVLMAASLPITAMADFSYYVGIGAGGSRVERDDIDLTFKVLTTSATGGNVLGALPPFSAGDGPPPYDADPVVFVRDPAASDFAYKLFAGARYGQHLGLEGGYIDLGTAQDGFPYIIPAIDRPNPGQQEPSGNRPAIDRQVDVETSIDGFQLYAVGFLPLSERFELFGKLGVIFWDRDTKVIDQAILIQPIDQPFNPDTLLFIGNDLDNITQADLIPCLPARVRTSGGAVDRTIDASCGDRLPRTSDSGTDLALGFGINIKASDNVSLRAEFEWFDIKGTDLTWASTMSLVFSF